MAHGKHQRVSSFWTQHMQRAARAEMALRINKAHKDSEREQRAKWYSLRVRLCSSNSRQQPCAWPELGVFIAHALKKLTQSSKTLAGALHHYTTPEQAMHSIDDGILFCETLAFFCYV